MLKKILKTDIQKSITATAVIIDKEIDILVPPPRVAPRGGILSFNVCLLMVFSSMMYRFAPLSVGVAV